MAYSAYNRLVRALKKSGIKYNIASGAANRGHGALGTIQSIMCHHTAGPASGNSPSLNVVTNGRPGLSGPLAQLFLARNGTATLVAAGRAYHAGVVKSSIYQNSHSIGIEAEATGTSSWPAAQVDAYAKLCKALCDEFNLSTSRVVGHKEACSPSGRKIDPNFSMSDFRKKVGGAKGGVGQNVGGGGGGGGSYESPNAKHEVGSRTMGMHDGGTDVNWYQRRMYKIGYDVTPKKDGSFDSLFGSEMKKFTRQLQEKAGIAVDGLAGKDTIAAAKAAKVTRELPKTKSKPKAPGGAKKFPWGKGHYIGPKSYPARSHSGVTGNDSTHIKTFVNQLVKRGWNAKKGGTYLKKYGNDGLYGAELEALIRAFQRDQGLAVDGLAGKSTWDAAFTNPVT